MAPGQCVVYVECSLFYCVNPLIEVVSSLNMIGEQVILPEHIRDHALVVSAGDLW